MKIKLLNVRISDVVKNYVDKGEEGVIGYDGKLNIRPKYQREFVYGEKERNAVIDTIFKGFPLNVMYWCKNEDGLFEVLDGQQRTISFCQFAKGTFAVMLDGQPKAFGNLTNDMKQKFLDYELMIYVCEGTDTEKLSWFQIINIAGKTLKTQEIRNAVYCGPWLTSAKTKFSKRNCAAELLSKNYVKADVIRQELLQTAIDWKSASEQIEGKNDERISIYMSIHQHDQNANKLWEYFLSVINWVQATFPKVRKEMKSVNWGMLYDQFHDEVLDTDKLEEEISALIKDSDVTKKSGVYYYVLLRDEKYLSIRAFDENMKAETYERQEGICQICRKHFNIEEMEADHITPWSEGGKTSAENCQMLCKECNRRKSDK